MLLLNGSRSHHVLMGAITALPITLMSLASCVSYAQLVSAENGFDVDFLAAANYFCLGITVLVTNLMSNCPYTMCSPDMTINLYLKCVLDGVALAARKGDLEKEAMVPTMCLALHVSSVVLGMAFWMLGQIRASVALNYLPYPVIAGFLSMVGATIVKAAWDLLEPLPGQSSLTLIFGLSIACVSQVLKLRFEIPTNLTSVVSIVASLTIFQLWAHLAGYDEDGLRNLGWLFPGKVTPISAVGIWQWNYTAASLRYALPGTDALALLFVACLQRALLITGVESMAEGAPYNIDDEMKSISGCVVAVSAVGGIAINPAPSLSSLVKEGAKGDALTARWTAVWVTGMELSVWLFGLSLNAFLPRFLLGGLLMGMGVSMLVDWVWLVRSRIHWTGSLVIFGMIFCSLYCALVYGILLGVVLAMFRLNFNLTSLKVIKYHESLENLRSGTVYPIQEMEVLQTHGHKVQIVGLSGVLFEGAAISLCKYLKGELRAHAGLEAIILDFVACQGINDSAAYHIMKVEQSCRSKRVNLVICNLTTQDERLMRSWEAELPHTTFFRILPSLREALESAEHSILEGAKLLSDGVQPKTLDGFAEKEVVAKWLGHQATKEFFSLESGSLTKVPKGAILIQQGNLSTTVFVAIPGYSDVQAELHTEGSRPTVLLRTRNGAICGVEGLMGIPSGSTWRAQCDSVCLRLDLQHVTTMSTETVGRLLKEGFIQQSRQAKHLSTLYSLSKCGQQDDIVNDEKTKDNGFNEFCQMISTPSISNKKSWKWPLATLKRNAVLYPWQRSAVSQVPLLSAEHSHDEETPESTPLASKHAAARDLLGTQEGWMLMSEEERVRCLKAKPGRVITVLPVLPWK